MTFTFIEALGYGLNDPIGVRRITHATGLNSNDIHFYQNSHVLPNKSDLDKIEKKLGINEVELSLKMGIFSQELRQLIAANSTELSRLFDPPKRQKLKRLPAADFRTRRGRLYHMDCLQVMSNLPDESVDMIFADPPFNLDKFYGKGVNDKLSAEGYHQWCQQWLDQCIRVLKPGGSFFLWHIPKWAQRISAYVDQFLEFRHWIAVKMNYGLPISGRLYPSHYSLLYFTKGKRPTTFLPDRIPIDACKQCGFELKDYGGHRDKLNPKGLNLQDVWLDINPVKHSNKKTRVANELSMTLLDRIIEMSTTEGDVVLDPFSGSGVCCVISELKNRKWIGCEKGNIQPILERFSNLKAERQDLKALRKEANKLFSDPIKALREEKEIWTSPNWQKETA